MQSLRYLIGLFAVFLFMGCESVPKSQVIIEPTYEQALNGNQFSLVNYSAVNELMKRYQSSAVTASNQAGSGQAPFIVATLVNIDQLEQSSTLGRLITEQLATRMTQLGFNVVDLKVRNSIYMKRNEGEFFLTREIKEVANIHKAQAVILGTYAESANLIYVNLKLVNPTNSMVLSAYDYALPLDRQVKSLMRKGQASY